MLTAVTRKNMPPRPTHRRSRHGCLRCKSLKVKCDQGRPSCVRCVERGLQCPGYVLSLRWASKNQLQAESPSKDPSSPAGSKERPRQQQQLAGNSSNNDIDLESEPFSAPPFTPVYQRQDYPDTADTIEECTGLPATTDWMGVDTMAPGMPSWSWTATNSLNSFDDIAPYFGLSSAQWNALLPGIVSPCTTTTTATTNTMPPATAVAAATSMTKEVVCRSSALVEYFFQEVISLYCAWDGRANMMRRMAERRWQSSEVLYHTMQSMAAACLSEGFPDLAPTAVSEHRLALDCLSKQNKTTSNSSPEDKLLSVILLGPTSSWHNPRNLARETLSIAEDMINECLQTEGEREEDVPAVAFFQTALDYWKMLLSFMMDLDEKQDGTRPHHSARIGPDEAASDSSIPAHPFTGISQETVKILAQVGALVYRCRKRKLEAHFVTDRDLDFFKDCIREARHIERLLLAYRQPGGLEVVIGNLGDDPTTTPEHLRKMDDAYRLTGLLQIYRVFPDLLAERYRPWDKDDILRLRVATKPCTKAEADAWLSALAMHILDVLREIPFESRTRCLQPFILVACSGELRRPTAAGGELPDHAAIGSMRARDFIQSRLASYRHVLPLPKVTQIQELVASVWALLDAGASDVYWLDVCFQKKLATLLS